MGKSERGWDPLGEALSKQDDMTVSEREILQRAVRQHGFQVFMFGPILHTRMAKGELDPNVPMVLAAFNRLRELEHPAEYWKLLREELGKIEKIGIQLFGVPEALKDLYGDGPLEGSPAQDSARDAFKFVDGAVWFVIKVVDGDEQTLREADCRYNREKDSLERIPGPSGGRPGRFLRIMVKEILLETGHASNSVEVREMIALELAPFFSAGELDTAKSRPLDKAVDNALG